MNLLTQNSKIKDTGKKHGVRLYNFTIPAFQDPESGRRTCPFAGACAKFCYARKGFYAFKNTKSAHAKRYYATKADDFAERMIAEIKKVRADIVRIHDAGDYYSREYRDKWLHVMQELPNVRFYSYTKSHTLFDEVSLPSNFDLIKSEGGTMDNLIQDTDRHSRIFDTAQALQDAGYHDASHDDLAATKWYNTNPRIGLIIH
jgi:hypothetical protein